jgi:serine protease Do
MPQMISCCFGLVLTLAAMAQAQNTVPQDPLHAADSLILDERPDIFLGQAPTDRQDLLTVNGVLPQDLDPRQQAYYVFPEYGDQGSGLTLTPVDDAERTHLKLPKGQGLVVTSVLPQGLAAQAGISQSDILLTLDDVPLVKTEDLEERLKAAGDKALKLELLHQGLKKTVQIQPRIKVTFGPVQPAPPGFWIGVSVTPVTPALRAQLQIPADQGLMVNEIIDDGPAAKSGFKVNDLFLSINGKHVSDQAELVKLVQDNGDKALAVEILREGSRSKIEVTPQRRQGSNLATAKLRHFGNWNVIRPGALLQGNGWSFTTPPNFARQDPMNAYLVNPYNANPTQPGAVPLANRLDTMAAEIKELRKAVDELSKALKDRK